MTVDAEIHVPGLDMFANRWTYHLMFMEEVHAKVREITVQATQGEAEHGRGAVYVNRQQWITVVKNAVERSADPFDCSYLSRTEAKKLCPQIACGGVEDLIKNYDIQRQFILMVEHFPGGSLSVYVITPD